jgi:RNA polymerase sigma-70 factor (ECF subfamily)
MLAVDAWSRMLAAMLERGRRAWPQLAVTPEAHATFVRRHCPEAGELDELIAEDVYLACACANGVPGAIEALEHAYARELMRDLGPLAGHEADEFRQLLRQKLFTGTPKIADYSGRGALRLWLGITAKRTYLDARKSLARRHQREEPVDAGLEHALGDDPELDYLKQRYRAEFKVAFEAALAALQPRQRNLLRLHVLHRVSIAKIAEMYAAHRMTISRWLEAARTVLLEGTRAELMKRLAIGDDELDSIMRLIDSRLDASIGRVLKSDAEPEPS